MNPLAAIRATPNAQWFSQVGGPGGVGGADQAVPLKPNELADLQSLSPSSTDVSPTGSTFASTLGRMISEVNHKQIAASDAVTGLISGQQVPLHQAVIAMEEASVSFQLMVELRNKLLESYQELMRMQV